MNTSAAHLVSTMATAALLLLLLAAPSPATAAGGGWDDAHATFYGDDTGAETMQGACGYGDLFRQGYGLETTALSAALFNDGWSCGACYELRCTGSSYCKRGAAARVTATNFCPANYSKPDGNWCNPPLKHFDLSKPMFDGLVTDFRVGIIPVRYRRVPCARKEGGVRFEMKSAQNVWAAVLVYNVAGAGDVKAMAVRVSQSQSQSQSQWAVMSRNWGQIWNIAGGLVGQALSFRVTTGDGRSIVFNDVVPSTWNVGQSFQGNAQF